MDAADASSTAAADLPKTSEKGTTPPPAPDKENESPQIRDDEQGGSSSSTQAKALCPLNTRSRTLSTSVDQQDDGVETNTSSSSTGLQPPGWANKTRGGKTKTTCKSRSSSVSLPEAVSGPSAERVIEDLDLSDEARQEFLREILKRTKPPARLTGTIKTYVDTETKRLATGIKAMAQKTGELVTTYKSSESAWRKNDEVVRAAAAKLGAVNKVQKSKAVQYKAEVVVLEKEHLKLKEDKEKIEKQVSKMFTKVEKAEEAAKEVKDQMDALVATSKRDQTTVQELTKANKQLTVALSAAQEETKKALAHNNTHSEVMKTKDTALDGAQTEISNLKAALAESRTEKETLKAAADVSTRELEMVKKAELDAIAQVQRMQDAQKNTDESMKTAIIALKENQQFSQTRIADLVKDKNRMEILLDELRNEKSALTGDVARAQGQLDVAKVNFDNTTTRLVTTEATLSEVEEKLSVADERRSVVQKQLDQHTALLHKAQSHAATAAEEYTATVSKLTVRLETAEAAMEEGKKVSMERESELEGMKATYEAGLKSGIADTQGEALEKLRRVSTEASSLRQQVEGMAELQTKLDEALASLHETSQRLFSAEKARRHAHNSLQDLKGNIRVVARARPAIADGNSEVIDLDFHPAGTDLTLKDPRTSVNNNNDISNNNNNNNANNNSKAPKTVEHKFCFNRVFGPQCSQADVFDEVSCFVQSSLDGYNVCLFSYGQTGSGKTHTMIGAKNAQGIIPRAVNTILERAHEMRSQGWEVEIGATFIEIYNETIYDLLREEPGSTAVGNNNNKKKRMLKKPSSSSTTNNNNMKHDIKHAADKRFRITNTRNVPITQFAHVQDLLLTADTNRSVAATESNAQSSRSHSVFSLYIDAKHTEKNCVLSGSLSMCDLAGSERLSKSKASGERLKETQAINKSLSSLADVFSALRSGNDHVPYRNSKLTYMLQPCFASGGKTMMVVNLSSEQEHLNETLCSLRFANQVNSTVVEKAKRRIRSSSS